MKKKNNKQGRRRRLSKGYTKYKSSVMPSSTAVACYFSFFFFLLSSFSPFSFHLSVSTLSSSFCFLFLFVFLTRMHRHGKTTVALASDVAMREWHRCLRAGAVSFFFFSSTHTTCVDSAQTRVDSRWMGLTRADSGRISPYRAKPLIQAKIQRLLRAISVRNSLFFIFFFFASSSSSLLCLLEWVLFCFFFFFFFGRVLFLLIRAT